MSKPLFNEFDSVSAKAWKQKIQVDLKGADYNDTLIWKSNEGIDVKPFYHSDEVEHDISIPASGNSWLIGQHIFVANAEMSNRKAIDAIERGAESILFIIADDTISVEKLLENIDVKKIKLHFKLQFLSSAYTKQLYLKSGSKNSISTDIIGNLVEDGNWYSNLQADHKEFEACLTHTKQFGINTALYQNAGASIIQQLAYSLAHANEYLNHINDNKSLQSIFCDTSIKSKVIFNVAVGTNYFFEIAKLRALRLLWHSLASEYNCAASCEIIATPTKRNKTIYDYNTNMLRTTTECMSAVLGGANIVSNLPYDAIYHKDNEFGERISRNQLLVLKHESYFNAVSNASDGSYYIESLTKQLAEKALILFKDIEKSGGFLKQLKDNTIQKKIKEQAKKEQDLFDSEKLILLGTNKHPNKKDMMKNDLELYPFVKLKPRKTLIEPVIGKRLAEQLEQERLKTED